MPGSIADSLHNKTSSENQSDLKLGDEPFQDDMWNAISPALPKTSIDKMSEESFQSNAPFMISEARVFYRGTRPPFVFGRRNNVESVTKPVIMAVNGEFPTGRREHIDLVSYAWDDRESFWTMEHGGEKVIVKAFSGAPGGGCTFRPWMGPERQFQDPVAFSITRRFLSNEIKDNSSSSEKDDEDSSQRRSSRGTMRTAKTEAAERITNSFVSPVSDKREEIAVEMYATDDGTQSEADAVRVGSDVQRGHITPTSNSNQAIRRSSHNIASHKKVKKRFSLKPKIESPPPSGHLKRRSQLSSRLESVDGISPRLKKMRRHSSLKASREESKLATIVKTPKASRQEFLSPSSSDLSPHQLMNTILHVSLPPRPDFVPIRLRSCNTMDGFFASISKAFDIQKHEHNLKAARVTFDWMPKNDKNRSWLVKKNVDDSFEMFLECVSASSVWADGGKAIVHVEILTKDWI